MDISMEKAMSLSHIWLMCWIRGNLRMLSTASPLYLDGKMTAFCSNGLFSFSCYTMTTFLFFHLPTLNECQQQNLQVSGWRVYRVNVLGLHL